MKASGMEIGTLLDILDEGYEHHAWHGPNLKGSLRGLTETEASWRPKASRHNIWEIAVHAAYWKYIGRRRLLREKRGSFPLKGSNWIKRPGTNLLRSWKDDRDLLDMMHRSLKEAVAGMSARELSVTPPGSRYSNFRLIHGIAMHDVYHAGQIQLLKRLMKKH